MNDGALSKINASKVALFIFVLCFGGVGFALVSQHIFDMQPCAWCILQRFIFIIIGILAFFIYLNGKVKKISISLWSIISILAIAGQVAAIYQFAVASKSFDCGISLAEKIISYTQLNELIPSVFGIFAMCADANPGVLGIPYVFYSLFLFSIISIFSTLGFIKSIK